MSSKTQICNMALTRLGASTIVNIATDNTTESKLCNTLFDTLADRVMIQGSWTTTIKRASLAQTTTTPSFEFANEFQLPVDPFCLKVLALDESVPGSIEHTIEGDKLLSDEGTIKIRYIGRLTDTEKYGVLLTDAIEVLLASYLAMPITGDKKLAETLTTEYNRLLGNNLAVDGQQGSKQNVIVNDLVEIR